MPTDLETILGRKPCHDCGDTLTPGISPFFNFSSQSPQGEDCPTCKGSGQLPLFPELWTECPRNKNNHASYQGMRPKGAEHRTCNLCSLKGYGTGLVPNVTEGSLLEELLSEDHKAVTILRLKDSYFCLRGNHKGDTPKDALIAALAASVR